MRLQISDSLVTASMISTTSAQQPRALVYRGPAVSEGCSEAVEKLLKSSPWNFQVSFAGPEERIDVDKSTLQGVTLFAFPGGPDLDRAYRQTKHYGEPLQEFVAAGGRYLGFCLGAYIAPKYGLTPEGMRVRSEMKNPKSQVRDDSDTVIQVNWTFRDGQIKKNKWLYFQEGPYITEFDPQDGEVLARYSKSGDIAASVTKYGNGRVGLVGPHPEADQSWYDDEEISNPDGIDFSFGYDLLGAMLR